MNLDRNATSIQADPLTGRLPMDEDAALRRYRLLMLLRGRYHWAILLAVIFGISGALGGYFHSPPEFRSSALIHIVPMGEKILYDTDTNTAIRRYDQFVDTQAKTIGSSRVLRLAVADPRWMRIVGDVPEAESISLMRSGLFVASDRREETIRIHFDGEAPPIAAAGVHSVLDAYLHMREQTGEADTNSILKVLEDRHKRLMRQDSQLRERSNMLLGVYGTRRALADEFKEKTATLRRSNLRLEYAQNEIEQITESDGAYDRRLSPVEIDELAATDPKFNQLILDRDAVLARLDMFKGMGHGEHHRAVKNTKAELNTVNMRIEQYIESGGGIVPAEIHGADDDQLSGLREREQELNEQIARLKGEAGRLSKKMAEAEQLDYEMDQVRNQIERVEHRIDELTTEINQAGRVDVLGAGEEPTKPYNQGKRIQFAVLGALAGVILGFGIVMLVGLSDRRLRHAEDAQVDLRSARMLGMLPTLPSNLSDPEQAAIAAHAVHHIRTLLQIGLRPNGDQGHVFAITGPESGSGKTSLTTALGLSFAASGSHTLLIDGDIVAGGMTRRFDNDNQIGLLDACGGRELKKCVAKTDVDNLDLLPIGSAQPHQAGSLSPDALHRLIDAARIAYDIVLIDTGPVLGSLEASIAATSAEGTVLVCSRGDQKVMAVKSLEHLHSINANVAGVVFNHALDEDMARSSYATLSAAQSRRSEPPPPIERIDPERSSHFGPLATAVAAYGLSGTHTGDGDHDNGPSNGKNTAA